MVGDRMELPNCSAFSIKVERFTEIPKIGANFPIVNKKNASIDVWEGAWLKAKVTRQDTSDTSC
jgi:hypothetical protein